VARVAVSFDRRRFSVDERVGTPAKRKAGDGTPNGMGLST